MKERTYLKLMLALTKQLELTKKAEPYDPDAYDNVLDFMDKTKARYHRSLLIKHWLILAIWTLIVLLLVWLVFFGRD